MAAEDASRKSRHKACSCRRPLISPACLKLDETTDTASTESCSQLQSVAVAGAGHTRHTVSEVRSASSSRNEPEPGLIDLSAAFALCPSLIVPRLHTLLDDRTRLHDPSFPSHQQHHPPPILEHTRPHSTTPLRTIPSDLSARLASRSQQQQHTPAHHAPRARPSIRWSNLARPCSSAQPPDAPTDIPPDRRGRLTA